LSSAWVTKGASFQEIAEIAENAAIFEVAEPREVEDQLLGLRIVGIVKKIADGGEAPALAWQRGGQPGPSGSAA
jgi:hypothetical protein